MKCQMLMGIVLISGLMGACGGKKESAPVAQKPPVAVETVPVQAANIVEGIDVTGNLEPKFAADVKTQIPGLVKQVYVTEWVRVSKGTPLARIDVAEAEAAVKRAEAGVETAKANLAQSQVAAGRADREMARALKLKEAGLATQQSIDDARTEADAAKARIEASRAQIRAAEEDVRQLKARSAKGLVVSPVDGVVALRDVNVGDLAGDAVSAKPIFRIVDNRLLNLTVTVSSADAARVKVGQPLEFSVDALPGKVFSGRVMYVNPELSSVDRSLKVIAEVGNTPEVLKGGFFAKGRIITGTRSGVLQVPRQSLTGWDPATRKGTLFVVNNDTAQARAVSTGVGSGDQVEIVSGVLAGEQYVFRGGFNLKDGDKVVLQKGAK